MKTVGIVGGIAPESTIKYYRQIIDDYRAHSSAGDYPSIIIFPSSIRQRFTSSALSQELVV